MASEDLIKRLRESYYGDCLRAADELERLSAELAEARKEIDEQYREIESWRKLVEDYKRDINMWASGKTFKEVYPMSPLIPSEQPQGDGEKM